MNNEAKLLDIFLVQLFYVPIEQELLKRRQIQHLALKDNTATL